MTGDDDLPVVPPTPERNWLGLRATVNQAMEWGIQLCGQLAAVHEEQEVVVGVISAATIERSRFDQPTLPEPDPNAASAVWEDIAALADAIRDLVEEPPPEFINALLPPYATALALGQELQDAQRDMGLPVAPIPYERARFTPLGGFPLEVPPEPDVAVDAADGEGSEGGGTGQLLDTPSTVPGRVPQDNLDARPNPWVLLAVAAVAAVIVLALALGWR